MQLLDEFKKADPIYGKPLVGHIYKKRLEIAIKLTKPYSKIVLDVGFGYGVLFPFLVKYNTECYGINISERQLNETKRILERLNIKNVVLQNESILNTSFEDSFFDFIYCIDVLEHIKETDAALIEIKRILKPGGYCVVSVPTENMMYNIGRKLLGLSKPKDHYYTSKEIEVKLTQYFRITERRVLYPIAPLFMIYCIKNDKDSNYARLLVGE